jgi:hypothetical protein
LHLQVLLGLERGRVYSFQAAGPLAVGRGSDCDVVLVSDKVSRRHARIAIGPRANELTASDLGSSNGTFVNGARIVGDGIVTEGDILLVGDVGLRLHAGDVPPVTAEPLTSANFAGTLSEIPSATVLRYLAVIKRSAVLVLTSPPLVGRVVVRGGHISEVLVSGKKTRDPIQALTAILRWRGSFELEAAPDEGPSALLGLDALLPAVGSGARAKAAPR